jgi:hypothetical protein
MGAVERGRSAGERRSGRGEAEEWGSELARGMRGIRESGEEEEEHQQLLLHWSRGNGHLHQSADWCKAGATQQRVGLTLLGIALRV